MNWLLLLLVFWLGLSVGSFVNVLIYRTWHGISPYKGRSFCDKCKRQLAWYENIPLLSYVVLRGRCRTCKKKIDASYPLVELTTGLLFVWWASLGVAFFRLTQAPLTYIQPLFWLLVGLVLVLVFFTDLLYGIIPDEAVAVLAVAAIVYRVFLVASGAMKPMDLVISLVVGLGAFLFFYGLYKVTGEKGMGFGDVKFAPVMGFLLGYPRGLVGFFLAFVVGGVVASSLILSGKRKIGQKVPFGPFLIIGLVAALLWGENLWIWYVGQLL